MKKKLMIIASGLCLLFALTTNKSEAQVKFGAIGGLNFSDVTGDYDTDGRLIGFHLGATVNFGITDFLMIEPQLLYSTKGANGSNNDLKLNYIEIPIWVRYQMDNGLNFNAGPYAGFLISAEAGDNDAKDLYTSTDFGLGFGIGYQMSGGLGFALNYNIGIANIGEDYTVFGQNFTYDAKNTGIKLSASYTFGGRRE